MFLLLQWRALALGPGLVSPLCLLAYWVGLPVVTAFRHNSISVPIPWNSPEPSGFQASWEATGSFCCVWYNAPPLPASTSKKMNKPLLGVLEDVGLILRVWKARGYAILVAILGILALSIHVTNRFINRVRSFGCRDAYPNFPKHSRHSGAHMQFQQLGG